MDDAIKCSKKEKMNMKNKFSTQEIMALVIMLVPSVYLGLVYSQLPATIPTHFGFHGPDAYGDKSQSWVMVVILTLVSLLVFALLKYLPFIDPKKTAAASPGLLKKIAVVIVIFMSFLQVVLINAMKGNLFSMERLLLPVMSIFFCFLGNLMLSIKPNYFVGFRLPWTLENEENWRKTHRLGGKLWFFGGILSAILTSLFPFQYSIIIFLAILFIISIIPIFYSYLYFNNRRQ
jgi:uncharacterized membrane protein